MATAVERNGNTAKRLDRENISANYPSWYYNNNGNNNQDMNNTNSIGRGGGGDDGDGNGRGNSNNNNNILYNNPKL